MNSFGSTSKELVSLVEFLGLRDLPLVRSRFTFFEYGLGGTRSRLDRFLFRECQSGWSDGVM